METERAAQPFSVSPSLHGVCGYGWLLACFELCTHMEGEGQNLGSFGLLAKDAKKSKGKGFSALSRGEHK